MKSNLGYLSCTREPPQPMHQKCKVAKEQWYEDRCTEIENLERTHNMRLLHQKVKDLTDRRSGVKTGSGCVRDKSGELLFEEKDIEKRWTEYISELYDDENRGERHEYERGEGPDILVEEVERALKKMKDGKAAGVDDISAECLKALGEESLKDLTKLCNKIYRTGNIPDDLLKSVFIALPKKLKATECSDHRTICQYESRNEVDIANIDRQE